MKKNCLVSLVVLFVCITLPIQSQVNRVQYLKNKLDSLSIDIPALDKKIDFSVTNTELPIFLNSVASTHGLNITIDQELNSYMLTHNFTDASVKNVLIYLCKEFSLTIESIGNILSVKRYVSKEKYTKKNIPITYDGFSNNISLELDNDTLAVVFKKITDVTGKNLIYSIGLANKRISSYIKNKSFEGALDKLAFSNNLTVTKTRDNYYLFEELDNKAMVNNSARREKPRRYKKSNFYYQVNDTVTKSLKVDFENTDIASVIRDIGHDLNIEIFTSTALSNIGTATVKSDDITFDKLLFKILEDTEFAYKKDKNLYILGKRDQASIRSVVTVPLLHRSIEIMTTSQSNRNDFSYSSGSYGQNYNQNYNKTRTSINPQGQNINTSNQRSFGNYNNKAEALVSILPKEVVEGLEVKTDVERNSFIVSGDALKIEKFKYFIKEIDKPIPVILIEVMIVEVNKSATVNTGVEFGLGEEPTSDFGKLYPSADFALGATTINKIIGGFNGFGSLNMGRVVPNFYAKIHAMETNGIIKVRSTPKLSTLNGHEAILSNGERSYYAITETNIIGSQNPQTNVVKNYVPIDADLSIAIKPMVAGDNQITMSINVVQSSFNEKRIDEEAPPGMNSREFTSIIRVRDQDVVILGGLEENIKNDSGSGVPFLSRIPVLKWLFSKKTRTNSKRKLSVLIKPTIIQ